MDLATFLAGGMQQGEEKEPQLTQEQIIEKLAGHYAKLQQRFDFEPGDIVVHKDPELALTKGGDEPMVFLDYLAKPINSWEHSLQELSDISAGRILDCRLGMLYRGVFVIVLAESDNYRPFA